jgi:acylphosphatase
VPGLSRRHLLVHGVVQGVFFREGVREQARAERLSGWVRNCSDGTVEAVFEGPTAAVERVVDWCRTGPPRARVDHVDVRDETAEGLIGFRVF